MRAREDAAFAVFCKSIGDGTLPAAVPGGPLDSLCSATVDLPTVIAAPVGSTSAELLSWVYEDFESLQAAQWPQFYETRSVLAPTNAACDELNAHMFVHLHGSL